MKKFTDISGARIRIHHELTRNKKKNNYKNIGWSKLWRRPEQDANLKKKIVWFLDSFLQEICGSTEDPRPRFHISQNVEGGPALSKNNVGSMSGDGGGERAIAKNVDVKRIGFVNAASSNPWLSPSTVILRFLGRKCLKALSGSISSEGGKKTPNCSLSFCKFRNSDLELHCRGHGGQRNYKREILAQALLLQCGQITGIRKFAKP